MIYRSLLLVNVLTNLLFFLTVYAGGNENNYGNNNGVLIFSSSYGNITATNNSSVNIGFLAGVSLFPDITKLFKVLERIVIRAMNSFKPSGANISSRRLKFLPVLDKNLNSETQTAVAGGVAGSGLFVARSVSTNIIQQFSKAKTSMRVDDRTAHLANMYGQRLVRGNSVRA